MTAKLVTKIIGGIKHLAAPGDVRTFCDRHAMSEGSSSGWITQQCYACHKRAGIA